MPTRHFFRKVFQTLVPTTEAGREWLEGLPNGEIVAGEFKRPRNVKHSAKFHAMLDLVYKNQSRFKTRDDLLFAFKRAIGHGHWVPCRIGGEVVEQWKEDSISFAKLDQTQWEDFYDRAIEFMCSDVIPGLDQGELRAELEGFVHD